jgi:hypothetical protein
MTVLWSRAPIGSGRQDRRLVAGDPVVEALSCDAQPSGDLGDFPTVLGHRQDRLITQLHDAQLHEHLIHLPLRRRSVSGDDEVSKISHKVWVARESNPEPTD